jgi:hypothetical protein
MRTNFNPKSLENLQHNGRPSELEDGVRYQIYLERADKDALKALPGEASVHARTAIREYLERQTQNTKTSNKRSSDQD